MKLDDLTGRKFGRLEVLERLGSQHHPNGKTTPIWWCKCECGNLTMVTSTALKSGFTKSCGCWRDKRNSKENRNDRAQGLSSKRLYSIYQKMIDRCNNPRNDRFHDYGGRGISVCEEWCGEHGFINFYKWASSNGYTDTLTIDRIDNNKNYSPDNCRWSDMKTQSRNKRSNHNITFNGETHCLKDWAKIIGVNDVTLFARLKRGWTVDRALTQKVQKYSRRGGT